jgi:hypothetical protein
MVFLWRFETAGWHLSPGPEKPVQLPPFAMPAFATFLAVPVA